VRAEPSGSEITALDPNRSNQNSFALRYHPTKEVIMASASLDLIAASTQISQGAEAASLP
jgi:hypothetical protein